MQIHHWLWSYLSEVCSDVFCCFSGLLVWLFLYFSLYKWSWANQTDFSPQLWKLRVEITAGEENSKEPWVAGIIMPVFRQTAVYSLLAHKSACKEHLSQRCRWPVQQGKNGLLVFSLKRCMNQDFSVLELLSTGSFFLHVTKHTHAHLQLAGVVILTVSSKLQARQAAKPRNYK